MKLTDCTKADLIWVIKRMCQLNLSDRELRTALRDLEYYKERERTGKAQRLTEAGVLLPCWRCGGEAELQEIHTGGKPVYAVSCKKHHCGAYGCAHQTKQNAVAYWNTRAPILSAEEMERLEVQT